jgi:hypothetical protein
MDNALRREEFRGAVYLVTSSGGLTSIDTARKFPVQLVESGPAGGAIFATQIAASSDEKKVLSFDMGGTRLGWRWEDKRWTRSDHRDWQRNRTPVGYSCSLRPYQSSGTRPRRRQRRSSRLYRPRFGAEVARQRFATDPGRRSVSTADSRRRRHRPASRAGFCPCCARSFGRTHFRGSGSSSVPSYTDKGCQMKHLSRRKSLSTVPVSRSSLTTRCNATHDWCLTLLKPCRYSPTTAIPPGPRAARGADR